MNNRRQTALHTAVRQCCQKVVESLCSLKIVDLLFQHDNNHFTALHYAQSEKLARQLVESMPELARNEFLLLQDNCSQTAMHTSVTKCNDEVVKYLCGLKITELLLSKDKNGQTVLHDARTKIRAPLFLQSVLSDRRREYMLMTNESNQTALHIAARERHLGVVEYFCQDDIPELLMAHDELGNAALHYACEDPR